MPGVPTITAFGGQVPPWSLVSLDANFSGIQALLKDVGNYSTYVLDAGAADAYVVTYGAGITFTLASNPLVVFKAVNACTGASTMNANATGVKSIVNVDGSALVANQIKAGGVYAAVYDGTNYQLLNPTPGIVGSAAVFSSSLTLAGDLTTSRAAAGTSVVSIVENTGNSASTNAAHVIKVGGPSADDPFQQFVVTGVTNWVHGIDNSATGDPYKISASNTIGTSDTFVMSVNGQLNLPSQPAFLAYLNTTAANQTGNGAAATVICNTEVFDQNNNHNTTTGVFTAPVAGRYWFGGKALLTAFGGGTPTQFIIQLVTTGMTIKKEQLIGTYAGVTELTLDINEFVNMAAGDTASLSVTLAGLAGNTATIYGDATGTKYTTFSGFLHC